MATATCQTIAGAYSAAQPFKVRSFTCATRAGAEMAAGNVAWGGSLAARKRVDWLPSAQVPVLDAGGLMSRPWYRFFQEIAHNRLGGIDAKTLPEVVTTATQTQAQVLGIQTGVVDMGAQVAAITGVVNTQTEVAQTNNLSGAAQISPLPAYRQAQLGISNQ